MVVRFENKAIRERELAWGKIIFSNKQCIKVETKTCTVIFHRWGAPHGHYMKCWRMFRQDLLRRKLDSIYDVYKYANKFEITNFVSNARIASRNDREIKLREEK